MVWSQICDFGGVPGSRKKVTLAVKGLRNKDHKDVFKYKLLAVGLQ